MKPIKLDWRKVAILHGTDKPYNTVQYSTGRHAIFGLRAVYFMPLVYRIMQ
jgi:hypothetical protein